MRVLTVDLVAGHPRGGAPSIQRRFDHLQGQTGLGGELHLLGNPGARPASGIPAPGALGKVEPTVDQSPSPRRRVGEKHSDLGILDLTGSAGVLPLHPAERRPFFKNPVSSTINTPPPPRWSST